MCEYECMLIFSIEVPFKVSNNKEIDLSYKHVPIPINTAILTYLERGLGLNIC